MFEERKHHLPHWKSRLKKKITKREKNCKQMHKPLVHGTLSNREIEVVDAKGAVIQALIPVGPAAVSEELENGRCIWGIRSCQFGTCGCGINGRIEKCPFGQDIRTCCFLRAQTLLLFLDRPIAVGAVRFTLEVVSITLLASNHHVLEIRPSVTPFLFFSSNSIMKLKSSIRSIRY